jgi:hypothetical protein
MFQILSLARVKQPNVFIAELYYLNKSLPASSRIPTAKPPDWSIDDSGKACPQQ